MKKAIIAIAILTLTLGYQNAQAQTSKNNSKPKMEYKMTVEQNKQVVIKFNNEFFGKGNTAITKELLAETFVNHSATPNAPMNASAMIKFITDFHLGVSDISVQVLEIFGEDNKVSV